MNKIKGLPTAKQWKKMLEEHERRQNLDRRVDGNNDKKMGGVNQ